MLSLFSIFMKVQSAVCKAQVKSRAQSASAECRVQNAE